MKQIEINAKRKRVKTKEVDDFGVLSWAVDYHLAKKSYQYTPMSPKNPLCFGIGPFAGSEIPGTHRLIFLAKSPLAGGMIISTLGGAGVALYNSGVDFVAIEDQAKDYVIPVLRHHKDKFTSKFLTLKKSELKDIYFEGYFGKKGYYALQKWVFDKVKNIYGDDYFRIITTGPGAMKTTYGSICSTVIEDKKIHYGQDDFAGRGGLGSVLNQAHGIPAIAFGGDYDKDKFPYSLKEMDTVNKLFQAEFGKKAYEVWTSSTKKYRYDEKMGTGGTFGVNFSSLGDTFLFFNWLNVNVPQKQRKELFEKLIKGWYWRKFQDEIIKTKSWKSCGEKCPVVCKKINLVYKKDYEPYAANGPLLGIFNMDEVQHLAHKVDAYGLDAVETGNIIAWVMESTAKGLLTEKETGIDLKPVFDIDEHLKNPIQSSAINSVFAEHILNLIVEGRGMGKYLDKGLKVSAEKFPKIKDLAAYASYGDKYGISPIMYWTPGVFAPLPMLILSKLYYGTDKVNPYEIGKACASKTIEETIIDNMGICRFHRKWSNEISDELASYISAKKIDNEEIAKDIVQKVMRYDELSGIRPKYWETKKVKNIVRKFVENFAAKTNSEEAKNWMYKFGNSFDKNMKLYWSQMLKGIKDSLK